MKIDENFNLTNNFNRTNTTGEKAKNSVEGVFDLIELIVRIGFAVYDYLNCRKEDKSRLFCFFAQPLFTVLTLAFVTFSIALLCIWKPKSIKNFINKINCKTKKNLRLEVPLLNKDKIEALKPVNSIHSVDFHNIEEDLILENKNENNKNKTDGREHSVKNRKNITQCIIV